MAFGDKLKELRTKKGYTQKQVADILKVGRPTIAGYETKNIFPDYEKLIVLANLFECSTDYLLGRVNSPKQFSTSQIELIESIINLLESEQIISKEEELSQEKSSHICNQLKTAILAIKLLNRIKMK